jgi:hypothetical protein
MPGKPIGDKSGENNPNWNGGQKEQDGRIYIHVPDHPRAKKSGYVVRARLVMEKSIGRLLSPEEVVHHKNQNTLDDRIENLQLLANDAEHARIHKQKLIEHNGTTLSVVQWAAKIGIRSNTIYDRLKKGWTVEKALTTPSIYEGKNVLLTSNGLTLTVAEWSKRTGIKDDCLRRRIILGWSDEKVINTPVRIKNGRPKTRTPIGK